MSRPTEPDPATKQASPSRPAAESTSLSQVLKRIVDADPDARWLVVAADAQDHLPEEVTSECLSWDDWSAPDQSPSEIARATFDAILLTAPAGSPQKLFAAASHSLSEHGKLIVVSDLAQGDASGPGNQDLFEATAQEAGFRLQRTVRLQSMQPRTTQEGGPSLATVLLRDGFRLRSCAEADVAPILELFERSFYHPRPAEHWRWKYQQNPWGNERITIIERTPEPETGGSEVSLVGQYCAYPVPFIRHDEQTDCQRMLCHQVGDTMTAKEVRSVGRGPTSLLARAARHFYTRHCRGQVAFNYGFNTGNIREFSKRFVGALDVMLAPYRVLPLPRVESPALRSSDRSLMRRVKGWLVDYSSNVEVRRIETLDQRFDRLVSQSLPLYRLLVERSSSYLEWRYLEAPDVEYRIYAAFDGERLLGWGTFRQREDELVWGDALFGDATAGRSAASAILDHAIAEAQGVNRVVAWFNPRPLWWARWLDGIGLVQQPEPNDLAMVVVPFEWPDPVQALQEELYLTMGDSDLF